MKKSNTTPLLPSLLRDRIISWASDNARQRMIVARPRMSAAELPDGVQMKRRKLRGKRLIVREKRLYGNTRNISAEWPDDGLAEYESPRLICVVNGQADYQVGEYLLTCGAGYFIFIPPQIPHPNGGHPHLAGDHAKDGFCEILQVTSYRHGIQCWVCRSHGSYHRHIHGENYLLRNERIHLQFKLMMEEAVSGEENHELVCGNLLRAFLLLLQRELNAGHYLLPGQNTSNEMAMAASNDFATELNRFVLAHLGEQLTLESVARQMHLSRSQFALHIRRQIGKTFIEYLTDVRLEEARILLRDSEWTTIAISEFVGFKSSTYFHRLFREKIGVTPGEFRQKSRQDPHKSNLRTKREPVRR
jgi:AraC-like DNA-binding protein